MRVRSSARWLWENSWSVMQQRQHACMPATFTNLTRRLYHPTASTTRYTIPSAIPLSVPQSRPTQPLTLTGPSSGAPNGLVT